MIEALSSSAGQDEAFQGSPLLGLEPSGTRPSKYGNSNGQLAAASITSKLIIQPSSADKAGDAKKTRASHYEHLSISAVQFYGLGP